MKETLVLHCCLFTVIFLMFLQTFVCGESSYEDVTTSIFGKSKGFEGYIAAFGDIDNDKHTDVFVIQDQKHALVLLGSTKNPPTLQLLKTNISSASTIKSLVPADFNGDGYMDILLVSDVDDSKVSTQVILNDNNGAFSKHLVSTKEVLYNQPLLLDVNGDMIADLFVSYPNKSRGFLLGHMGPAVNWSFNACEFVLGPSNSSAPLKTVKSPHSNAFLDLTGEGSADLVITTLKDEETSFEVWRGNDSGLLLIEDVVVPHDWAHVGQSVFADIDGDGIQDLIVPVCDIKDQRCTNSRIYMYRNKHWFKIFQAESDWNFVAAQSSFMHQPITLVVGDYNQDVFIDLLCVMEHKIEDSFSSVAVMLYGGLCSDTFCGEVGRKFSQAFSVPTSRGAFSAAFFDLESDGTLDFLVSVQVETSTAIRAYQNKVAEDVSFLMVKVLPGLKIQSSSNVPGITISYTTTNTMGGSQQACATQLPQSAYLSLQLPYVSFGLGRLPNFVDSLSVSIPRPLFKCDKKIKSTDTSHVRLTTSWTMLIPNSQLFVKPYPIDEPDSWTNRLLVTPSQNVITTGIVLLSTCGIIALAIIGLHCLERREDRKEKIQDAHRFHFDAM